MQGGQDAKTFKDRPRSLTLILIAVVAEQTLNVVRLVCLSFALSVGIKVKKRSMVLLITAKLTFTMSPHGGMTNDAWCQQTSLEKCGAGSHGASWCFNAQRLSLTTWSLEP